MQVNPAVTYHIGISKLTYMGTSVYILTADDQYLAGSWDDIQEFLCAVITTHTLAGLAVANINLQVI